MSPTIPFMKRLPSAVCVAIVLAALQVPGVPIAAETEGSNSAGAPTEEDEFIEGPFEGSSSIDETFSPPGITQDWIGARSWLYDRGVEFSVDLTQGVHSVIDGGFDEQTEYLGSSEVIFDVGTETMGLWPGGFFRVSGEGRFGSDVVAEAGTLSPVNNDALFPADPDEVGKDLVALTEMTATQFLAPWVGLYAGLMNTTSGDANDYAGFARSNEYFQNTSFLYSMVSSRIVPSVALGGASS